MAALSAIPSVQGLGVPDPNYGAGNYAQMLQQGTGGIGDAVWEGMQRSQQRQMQQPVLGANGQPSLDYNDILKAVASRGGLQAVAPMLPQLMGVQADQQARQQFDDTGGASSGVPASIRTNNPGAQWAGPTSQQYGSTGKINLPGGNNAAVFPDKESGAAAQFALLDKQYAGKTLKQAIADWGGKSDPKGYQEFVTRATGIPLDAKLTPEMLRGPEGIKLAQTMARFEAGREYPMKEDQWKNAQSRAFDRDLGKADELSRAAQNMRRAAAAPLVTPNTKESLLKQADAKDAEAKQYRETAQKNKELTTAQKDLPTKEAESQAGAVGAAKGKRIAEVIESGGQAARHTINTLDVMEDAFRKSGDNLFTGPGSQEALKLKQAVNNMFPGTFNPGDVVSGEAITKLNAQLAAEAAKSMTARPSQLEFKAFMANNPGLSSSPQGSMFLINMLRQMKQQDIELSKEADKFNPTSGKSWGDAEDKFYNDHPLINPLTGKPLNAGDRAESKTAGSIPDAAIQHLRTNPDLRGQFDAKYGKGASDKVLGAGNRGA